MHFAIRSPVLSTIVATVVISALAVASSVVALHLVGPADFPVAALTLSIVMPALLVPVTIYPLLLMNRRQRALSARLERLAHTDALTELPNRRAFFEAARTILSARPAHAMPIAALMIDVDHFKEINDTYGHDHGDMVLKRVADMIRIEIDAVKAPQAILARIGGDEFAAIIGGLAPGAVGRLAERICGQVYNSVGAGDRLDPVMVSVGVAVRKGLAQIDDLMKGADDAVYTAKRGGRDRWAFAGGSASDAPQPMLVAS